MRKNLHPLRKLAAVLPVCALALTGCQSPSGSGVDPVRHPGLVQGDIPVTVIQAPVKVIGLDTVGRTITLERPDHSTKTFSLAPTVGNLDRVRVGDVVKATVQAKLSVYVLDHGRLPNADGTSRPRTVNFNARVLAVDLGRRRLTLGFDNGHHMTIQAAPDVQLEKMAPGDDVVMRANEITAIEIEKS